MSDRYKPFLVLRNRDGSLNVPDEILAAIWENMQAQGKDKIVFYNGHIKTLFDWISFVHDPSNHFVLVMDTEEEAICGVTWINCLEDRAAKLHFCIIGPYKRGMGEAAMQVYDSYKWTDGTPLLQLLIGLTPECYESALKLVKMMGFKVVGTIPDACYLAYEDRRVGGVVTYYHPGPKGGE
jgi:hypothetical protein